MNVVVTHWSANVVVVALCSAVVVVHLLGMRATATGRQGHGPAVRWRAAVAFYFGLLAVVVALVSPVAYWSLRYTWVRSLQDVLLAIVAPALIVLGAPWLALARGVGRRPGPVTADRPGPALSTPSAATGPGRAGPWASRRQRRLSWPMAVTVAFNAAWWGWHMPDLYDAAVRFPAVRAAEVVVYLGLGVAFWLQLIGSDPFSPRLPPVRRVTFIAATVASDTVLGIWLVFGANMLYPAYLAPGHHVFGVVADQQLGGAVLWLMPLPIFIIAAVALLLRWLKEEESEALTAGFGRLLEPRTSTWPTRPGLR